MTRSLPPHLRKIGHVFVDESMRDSAMARRVREKLAGTDQADIPWTVVPPDQDRVTFAHGDAQALYLKEYKGKFLRFCPGTRAYHCCGYRIIHIGENCPMACSYCILQAYFQDRVLKIWANQDDLFTELGNSFGVDRNTRYPGGHRRIHRLPGPGAPDRLQCQPHRIPRRLRQRGPGTEIQGGGPVVDGRRHAQRPGPARVVAERALHQRARGVRRLHPARTAGGGPAPAPRPGSGSACTSTRSSTTRAGARATPRSST